jgi:hypothetical protein
MTTRTIKAMLRAAIFTGAVALPMAALADADALPSGTEGAEKVPDHAQAEARTAGGGEVGTSGDGVADHAQAEARTAGDASGASSATHEEGVPDHAAAEARSTADQTHE